MTKRYSFFLLLISAFFVLLYVLLCWHSRLATDDYSYIWEVYSYGVLNEVHTQYMLWSGRIIATLLTDVIYHFLDVDQTWYFLYPLLSGCLLMAGISKNLGNISTFLGITITPSLKRLAAALVTMLLFFLTIDIGETWFWYNSISHYLGSVIAFTWGLAFLFNRQKTLLSAIGSVLCFIYVGSASEVYSVVFGQLFLWLIYTGLKKHNYKLSGFLQDAFYRKTIIVAFFFLLSFIVTVIAPGNYVRAGFFPKPSVISTIRLSSYMFGKLFFWFLPKKILYMFAFTAPFLIIGKSYNRGNKLSWKDFFKNTRWITFILLLNCFLVFGLIAFIMSVSGEYRIWFVLSFLFSIYLCGITFYIGYSGLLGDGKAEALKKISLVTAMAVMPYTIIDQYRITKKYADAHDQRVSFLLATNERIQKDTLITLPLLPPSGMLYSAEITGDADHFLNEELKQGYRLKYHVISEKKVP